VVWLNWFQRKCRRVAALSPGDRLLALHALLLLPPVSIARRLISFRRLSGLLTRLPRARAVEANEAEARRAAELVARVAANLPLRLNCLERSLVLWALLNQRGIVSELRFGVRRDGTRLDVHAWVEYEGVVLNDRPDIGQRYTVITPA